MMKIKKVILLIFVFVFAGCIPIVAQSGDNTIERIADFFAGTWKMEGRESYEKWEKAGNAGLRGKSFKVKDGKENVSETLEIKEIDGKIYYLATVLKQNEGATIRFALTSSKDDEFIFENPEHDFPKKISYKKLSEKDVFVNVTGEGGKGFSFKMSKLQPTADSAIPGWVKDYFKFRTEGTGRWITDNSKYVSENEPFDEYVTEWVWGAGRQSIKGRLFGLKDKKEIATFAEFRMFWHPGERKVITQAFGAAGNYSLGEMQFSESKSEIRIEHTAYTPDGGSYRELHKEIGGTDEFRSESFIWKNGDWQAQRPYIWKRQKTVASNRNN